MFDRFGAYDIMSKIPDGYVRCAFFHPIVLIVGFILLRENRSLFS